MTFNGLTDKQAENSRKKYGSNRGGDYGIKSLPQKLAERFERIPVKIYILILLLYTAVILFLAITGASFVSGADIAAPFIMSAAAFISVAANCFSEMRIENRSVKHRKKSADILCKVYRCGNTVTEIPAGDIVKGDYVLLTEGDIVPAEGYVVHGDITSEGNEGSRLIRNYEKSELKKDVSGEYTLEKGEIISSGYAVIKITSVSNAESAYDDGLSAGYKICFGVSIALATALLIIYIICAAKEKFGAQSNKIITFTAFYSVFILLACEGLRKPDDFFRRAKRSKMYHDGIRAKNAKGAAEMIFADKASFATDGRPFVTGFTDGKGKSYTKFYEVPYPLGTIVARAAAANTSALINRGKIIGADTYECAEMNFISERIRNTLDLEITPLLINGELKNFEYKKFLKGSADKIIRNCSAYFDPAGKRQPLSNTTALTAMADELSFQGNRVFAYAAEDYKGGCVFIGMMTVHEKLRGSSAAAYKNMTGFGIKVIMLDTGGSADYISIADKAVTGALRDEIISFDRLAGMQTEEAVKLLPKLKIITGEHDKETLLKLAGETRYSVGMTVSSYEDIESSAGADVLYAPSSACAAVQKAADAVMSEGLSSVFKYGVYSRAIKAAELGYTVSRIFLMLLTAAMMCAPLAGVLGEMMCIAAAVFNIIMTAAADNIFCRIPVRFEE